MPTDKHSELYQNVSFQPKDTFKKKIKIHAGNFSKNKIPTKAGEQLQLLLMYQHFSNTILFP